MQQNVVVRTYRAGADRAGRTKFVRAKERFFSTHWRQLTDIGCRYKLRRLFWTMHGQMNQFPRRNCGVYYARFAQQKLLIWYEKRRWGQAGLTTLHRLYRFVQITLKLWNGRSTFQRTMDAAQSAVKLQFALIYVDITFVFFCPAVKRFEKW